MSADTSSGHQGSRRRGQPSVSVAFGVFVVYVIVFIGLTSTSGAAYDEWWSSGANAWRSGVLSLAAASVVLIAFLAWARWDHVFRDPERLWMSRALLVPVVLFVVGIVAHLATVDWGAVGLGLLVPTLLAGIGVGFVEETMFRGIILRALRAAGRREAAVMLLSSAWFGLFHLTNILNDQSVSRTVVQVVVVSAIGVVLYLFRRRSGSLVPAMVAHGLWDISLFLPTTAAGETVTLVFQIAVFVAAVVAAVGIVRGDETAADVAEASTTRPSET